MPGLAPGRLAVLLAFGTSALGVAPIHAQTRPIAGVFALDAGDDQRWGWTGAWLFPVGDPHDFLRPAPDGAPGYRVNRGLADPGEGKTMHEGADLANGRGGDVVRAAAHGLVVVSARAGWHGGYGRHVVIAHRLADGTLAYSVYAHLSPGSVRPRAGELVAAGEALARVGRSGRASTEHLHFEIRIAADPQARWERARVVDPVAFVTARLPADRPESGAAAPYLEWGECGSLLSPDDASDAVLTRARWWRILARGARHGLQTIPGDPSVLRTALIGQGLLPRNESEACDEIVSWAELARDLARVRTTGTRLVRPPMGTPAHRATCASRLDLPDPRHSLERLGRRDASPPTIADACVVFADLSGPWESARPRGVIRRRGGARPAVGSGA